MNEKEFLESYQASDYSTPLLTVDSVLFTVEHQSLKVLLVQRANHPNKGRWSLPGGFINMKDDKSTEDTALRKIIEKTKVTPAYLEQLQSFSSIDRDPRGWSATVSYFALIAHQETKPQLSIINDTNGSHLMICQKYNL